MSAQYNGITLFREAAQRHSIRLTILVAETGFWANPEVHQRLMKENGTGAFFPRIRRYREGAGEVKGQLGDERLDDNTYANHAIKQAVGIRRDDFTDFQACHIWPQSCYDARYYTVLANIVLLPAPLAGLSDHDPDIQAALQFRSYELYDWHPMEYARPLLPEFYPPRWVDPMPFTADVERAIRRRRRRL
jgi:hypothetical protein